MPKVSKIKEEGKIFKYIFNNEININLNLSPLKVAQLFDFNNFPFVIIYTGRSRILAVFSRLRNDPGNAPRRCYKLPKS